MTMKTKVEIEWISADQPPETESIKMVCIREERSGKAFNVYCDAYYSDGVWRYASTDGSVNGGSVIAWASRPTFEGFPPVKMAGLSFGAAIEALKAGRRVTRAGWNGRGMYLWLLPAAAVKAEWCREAHLKEVAEANGGEIECLGSVRMYTVNAEGRRAVLTGWLASQSDILSEDWQILE